MQVCYKLESPCDDDNVMIIMMKQYNGLLFGEGVFLDDSLSVIVSRDCSGN